MRRSIFDILAETYNQRDEVERIIKSIGNEKTLYFNYKSMTILSFVDENCFPDWKQRGHCLDLVDFMKTVGFSELKDKATTDVNAFLTLIELLYNIWYLSRLAFDDHELKWQGNYFHVQQVMDDNLEKYNHKAYYVEQTEQVFVIEDKENVTAVAEIINQDLALDVIKYNHRILQGDIDTKKAILLRLGSELEPKRKQLHKLDSKLEDNVFFALNNLNLRHNNRSKKDKNYKEYVAKMRKDRLEKWYDEVYQMMLLAFLLIDNVDRNNKFDDLKTKIKDA